MNWWDRIKTKEDYDALSSTGMMFEFHPDIPSSWKECEDFLKKKECWDKINSQVYKDSCKLEGIE